MLSIKCYAVLCCQLESENTTEQSSSVHRSYRPSWDGFSLTGINYQGVFKYYISFLMTGETKFGMVYA